jgi:hypothetical protein
VPAAELPTWLCTNSGLAGAMIAGERDWLGAGSEKDGSESFRFDGRAR